MPSTLTHWRILIEALRGLPDGARPPAPAKAVRVLRGKRSDAGYGLPILAFLGAIGPDLPYSAGVTTRSAFFPTKREQAQRGKSPSADLLHYNQSGAFLIELLRRGSQVSSPELRQKVLYYALGHATHIAGDTIVHPLTNTFAGAYHHQSNPTVSNNLGIHFRVEFCQDLATDIDYFHAAPRALAPRPWLRYLAGAEAELVKQHQGASLLSVLKETARAVYGLDATMTGAFGEAFISGLRGVRTLSRWLRLYPIANPVLRLSPRLATYFTQQGIPGAQDATGVATFQQALDFASCVGGRLCALLVAYDAALAAGQSTTGEAYVRLRHDLRDWNLDTGYAVETQPAASVTLRHSWHHFLSLRGVAGAAATTLPIS
ncbi:MAG TPA: zinc dependent phospholipase C family protein [Ktedonobacterales bacterium]|nr:zinc dependent phospholipase C family protein [Ktedonobacterales bacterium]